MTKDLALSLAQRVQRVKPSPTLAVSAKAEELQAAGKDIINLGVGEPDFDTPEHIKQAAIKAINEGQTKYTAVDGTKSLKQAIINKFAKENGLTYDLSQILVSAGAKHSLANLFSAVLDAGDEVIIPAPFWVSYPDMVKLADGEPVIVKTTIADHFKMTAQQLESAITSKTRLVLLNSPSNPTGVCYTKEELKALGDALLQHPNIIVVTDDIYEKNIWGGQVFANIVNAQPALYDRCVVINGVSKTYAMTGWRIGYAAGPAKIIGAMKKLQSQSTSNPCSIAQAAAQAALEGDQTCASDMTAAYKQRHDYLISELQTIPGIKCIPSNGTFYTMPNVEGLFNKDKGVTNDLEFSEFLLNEVGVAVVPGSAFGAPGHIRLCYTVSMDKLKEVVARLKKAAQLLN